MNFSSEIRNWYHQNHRKLPWRETQNPYYIWLSEVILQQTRVDQGLNYYLKFIQHYPRLEDMANAPEEKILKDWQGLGYYSRARNMHAASKTILHEQQGRFPDTYAGIRALKGVGDYTAAAIASICYHLPYPVLDGNVYRVITRIFGIDAPIDTGEGKKMVLEALNEFFDPEHPGEFNQAIMEFGALHCTPSRPDCENCIFSAGCIARKKNLVNTLPVKSKKTKVRNRYFYYLVILHGKQTYLEKRTGNDIWKGLYQFPLIESEKKLNDQALEKQITQPGNYHIISISKEYKHVLSHQHIYCRFITIIPSGNLPANAWTKVPLDKLQDYPVARLTEKYLAEANLPE